MSYLRIQNENSLCDELFEIKPKHRFLHYSPLVTTDRFAERLTKSEFDEYVRTDNEFSPLAFKGLIDYGGGLLRAYNGVRFDVLTNCFVHFNTYNTYNGDIYEYFKHLHNIIPEINNLAPNLEYDYFFIDPNKPWPEFSNEEWDDFVNKCLKESIFIDTYFPIN